MQIGNIKEQKNALRKRILKSRRELSVFDRDSKSSNICKRLILTDEINRAKNVCTYISKKGEVSTDFLINELFNFNKAVYAPVSCLESNKMSFYRINSSEDLKSGAFSVLEPVLRSEKYEKSDKNDICIVPALSFDRQGFRLGYGKGYYDRFLKDFDGIKIGLCFDEFVTETLPKYETDIAVDMIITETEKFYVKAGS